jgi:hypothetical protein
MNNTKSKEGRKRKATSRLKERDEALTKKLKEAQHGPQQVHPTSETMSQTSTVPSMPQATTSRSSPMSTDNNTIDDTDLEIIQPPTQNNPPPSDNGNDSDQEDQGTGGPEDPQKALGK